MKNISSSLAYLSIQNSFHKVSAILLISLIPFFISGCSKDSRTNIDDNGGRYQYPNYINGYLTISHSWYRICDDTSFNHSSKEFFVEDTIFANISEVLGPFWQAPEIGLDEKAEIVCSNGDIEKFVFNYPYPNCVTHIDGVLLWFSGIKTHTSQIILNNDFIDIDNDTVVVVAHYKSYWTGNMVRDTAYIYP